MAVYPGATFKPTSWGGRVPRNRQGRGMLHVAVSERTSYPPNSGVTWHFYIAKAAPDGSTDGSGGAAYCEQYVDTDLRAYGGAEGNDDQLIVETAGGMGSSRELNAEPWTRAQMLRIADLMRWEAAQPGGAPLELLPDSRAGRRGWGPHRLGIKHSAGPRPGWWQPGGEVWSNALGKECPGDAKVAQVPEAIQMARSEEDDMPIITDEDARKVALAVLNENRGRQGGPAGTTNLGSMMTWSDAKFAEVNAHIAALAEVVGQQAKNAGAPIDMAAVEAAAKAGAGKALAEGVDVDITVGGQPSVS